MSSFDPTTRNGQSVDQQQGATAGSGTLDPEQNGNTNPTHENEPPQAQVDQYIAQYEAMGTDPLVEQRAQALAKAIAFVHFDAAAPKNDIIEALVHQGDLIKIDRGLYVFILSDEDKRRYSGRIVEGPFFDPDVLKRDSTPVQFIILNQGQGKQLSLPEYHGRIHIELLGEEVQRTLYPTTRRPRPASPIYPYESEMMSDMLNLGGNLCVGHLDTYEGVLVHLDGDKKDYLPRNILTVGTVGSGKSNTDQVLIEETVSADYAQVVIDPEGEYTLMDQPVETDGIQQKLELYKREPRGVARFTVYHPPHCISKRQDAKEFSVPFDSLSPELIAEITDMNDSQAMRFTFLYEQAINIKLKEENKQRQKLGEETEANLSRGYPGMTLDFLLNILDQEFMHHEYKREEEIRAKNKKKRATKTAGGKLDTGNDTGDADDTAEEVLPDSEVTFYCRVHRLKPLIESQPDVSSYGALRKKLRELRLTRLFDQRDAPKLNMEQLSQPGQLTVIDMSDCDDREVKNIIIADLLARMYRYKIELDEETNKRRKVILTIEEAHSFVSRDNKEKMAQTFSQLQRVARRGRKRWLILHFVTQSPQHLPSELFELANNKIIHQTTGTENLRVLKLAAGTINESIWSQVPSLGIGRAVIVSSQYPHPIVVRIRPAASQRNYTL